MVRYYPHDPDFMGPPGICLACGKQCSSLHHAGSLDEPGIVCYRCGNGRYLHRGAWRYTKCPEPHGPLRAGCETCKGNGVVAALRDIENLRRGQRPNWVPWWMDVPRPADQQ